LLHHGSVVGVHRARDQRGIWQNSSKFLRFRHPTGLINRSAKIRQNRGLGLYLQ